MKLKLFYLPICFFFYGCIDRIEQIDNSLKGDLYIYQISFYDEYYPLNCNDCSVPLINKDLIDFNKLIVSISGIGNFKFNEKFDLNIKNLRYGTYDIIFKYDGFYDFASKIQISKNKDTLRFISLSKIASTIIKDFDINLTTSTGDYLTIKIEAEYPRDDSSSRNTIIVVDDEPISNLMKLSPIKIYINPYYENSFEEVDMINFLSIDNQNIYLKTEEPSNKINFLTINSLKNYKGKKLYFKIYPINIFYNLSNYELKGYINKNLNLFEINGASECKEYLIP